MLGFRVGHLLFVILSTGASSITERFVMIRIEEIVDNVARNHPQANLDLLRRAYLFSAREHKGQKRASGESYLVHPLEVANILANMKLDEVSVATGLLHDVVEDTLVDLDTIREYFGEE